MPVLPTQIDAASPKAQVLAAGERVAAVPLTLELGATAKINNQEFTIIGMMRRADDEGTQWNEYLMYGPRAGFSWWRPTKAGPAPTCWRIGRWRTRRRGEVVVDKVQFSRLYDYGAVVTYAVGAFNWRVAVGDSTRWRNSKPASCGWPRNHAQK
jgi:hypothetical protein